MGRPCTVCPNLPPQAQLVGPGPCRVRLYAKMWVPRIRHPPARARNRLWLTCGPMPQPQDPARACLTSPMTTGPTLQLHPLRNLQTPADFSAPAEISSTALPKGRCVPQGLGRLIWFVRLGAGD